MDQMVCFCQFHQVVSLDMTVCFVRLGDVCQHYLMPTFTGLVKVIISGFFEIILNGSFGWNIHEE